MKKVITTTRISIMCAALLALAGCGSMDGLTRQQGTLVGAGAGALLGAAASDSIIAPVLGAVGGAIVGEELSESDPLLD